MKKLALMTAVLTISFSTITVATQKNEIYIKQEPKMVVKASEKNKKEDNKEEKKSSYKHYQTGIASFYGGRHHGGPTASGERFNQNAMTAAHKTLPFGTRVKVTSLRTGRSVIVRINDRGPYVRGRVIDLSRGAFSKIASTGSGITRVKLEIVK